MSALPPKADMDWHILVDWLGVSAILPQTTSKHLKQLLNMIY
jgi:hypothetical protein